MLIQTRIVAKCLRPKTSPPNAQVTELMPLPNENKMTKTTYVPEHPITAHQHDETQIP